MGSPAYTAATRAFDASRRDEHDTEPDARRIPRLVGIALDRPGRERHDARRRPVLDEPTFRALCDERSLATRPQLPAPDQFAVQDDPVREINNRPERALRETLRKCVRDPERQVRRGIPDPVLHDVSDLGGALDQRNECGDVDLDR